MNSTRIAELASESVICEEEKAKNPFSALDRFFEYRKLVFSKDASNIIRRVSYFLNSIF